MTLRIDRADLTTPDAAALIGALNHELSGLYPEPGANHFGLAPSDIAPGRGALLIAYRDGQPVGCGAVRLIKPQTAELKRMYVAPYARGSGFGRHLVQALEEEAARIGATRVVLETGIRQRAAIALYARCGYTPVPLYGEYTSSPGTSVCLARELR